MSTRVLVTGGAGFIGSHLTEALLRAGHSVRVLDDLSSGRRENLANLNGDIDFIEGDICDAATVKRAVAGVDTVFHQAAMASVPRSVERPRETNTVNIGGTLELLCAARDAGVRRFVFASSSSIYGDNPVLPKSEEMALSPISPYGLQKQAGEQYVCMFHRLYGLETLAIRYFNVFGPRQNPESDYAAVIPIFITRLLQGRAPTVYGDGEQSRDFTYVENVVRANMLCMDAPSGAVGRAYNVACGERYSLNDLLRMINAELGTLTEAEYTAPRPGDVKHSQAAIALARRELSFEPVVGIEEGLASTIAYYRGIMQG
ncbi:MAG: SDR family oxidoreductase [Verrucomicrobiota bacterium]|nr:SDR family oxidoreductase [Verrucomicrobiota bacterium]MDD8045730.1 SDR family oxidoreductase [Verrucomicrobiota bacterium]MDD8050419.1 SDR family oxidoreductase [Verrucomicrobiota bacterium]